MRYGFAGCMLDTGRFELERDGQRVALEPQVLELLIFLVENRDRLVTRDEILAAVWKGRVVSDTALSSRIKAARRAIGDDGQAQRLIETLHGRGFRFRGAVAVDGGAEVAAPPAAVTPSAASGPAIAVLPFLDLGAAPDPVLADGITEELIASLGRFRWFPVIARESVLALRGRGLDPAGIAATLGVAYLVEGSVLRHGQDIRVHARLVEAEGGRQLAAARLDRRIDDLFALLDDIGAELVRAIHPGVIGAELDRALRTAPSEASAWQLFIRAQTLGLAHADFIEAERVMGASHARIIFRHLLPNVVGPLLIVLSMDVPVVIMLEAGLSYLGLGVKPPSPSWGNILYDGYVSLRQAPFIVVIAGLPLVLATIGFTFLGEGLRDALDPKLQGRVPG